MRVGDLDALEAAIAAAGDEALLFHRAGLLVSDAEQFAARCRDGAFADAAMLFHRALLPGHGFQFGETAAQRGLASSWARGDFETRPFEAATPGLALLRATLHAKARRLRDRARADCTLCRGRGWTRDAEGHRLVCAHGSD